MSSHHFVKENQEPALIIANGEACSDELLGQLLEWSPFVVVLDGALPRVLERGIRMDAVLGDFDSCPDPAALLAAYGPVELLHTPDQEQTDLEKAIAWLIDKNHHACNIVWATGRRADHTFNNLITLARFAGQIDMVLWDDHSRVFPLRKSFKKWYPAGFPVSLLPLPGAQGIRTANLVYNLHGETLEQPLRTGSSNRSLQEGFVEISYESGCLLLMECFDKPGHNF
jgi:thiamine pyrophosphokinase